MQPQRALITVDEYLAEEAHRQRKHEYVDGETYAMVGASRRHNILVSNIHVRAGNAASRTKDCQVFGPDMKLFIPARNSFYYPDLSACCDPTDRDERFLTKPCLIVEVLSPATASIDRREKRMGYETIPSLREYVIVEQGRMRVDVYRRQAGVWLVQVLTLPNDVVEASCLNLWLPLSDIYANVELSTDVEEQESPEYEVT
jgi:Uma2 family endonuclease